MKYRIAINGYGRIGRGVLRALYEHPIYSEALDIVAINEIHDLNKMAYLTRFDSVHGKFMYDVSVREDTLCIQGDSIKIHHVQDPAQLDWGMDIDMLLECSGSIYSQACIEHYLDKVPCVLLSCPMPTASIKTVIWGVNENVLQDHDTLVSAGSCTAQCIVPVLYALDKHFGVDYASTTTIHSIMNDQPIMDGYHSDVYSLNRSAVCSAVTIPTQLAHVVGEVMPTLQGKLLSSAWRVPIPNVSAIDLMVCLQQPVSYEALDGLFFDLASSGDYGAVLGYVQDDVASTDFMHDSRSVIISAKNIQIMNDRLIRLVCWFDNEWGFCNRMLDLSMCWLQHKNHLPVS